MMLRMAGRGTNGVLARLAPGSCFLVCLAFTSTAWGGIRFQPSNLMIEGIPRDFLFNCWALVDPEGRGHKDILIGGSWDGYDGALLVRNVAGRLSVVRQLFVQRVPEDEGRFRIASLSACDIDKDSCEELFAIGHEGTAHRMARFGGGRYSEETAPLPPLAGLRIAWLDVDGDSWVDLVAVGGVSGQGRGRWLEQVLPRVWRNVRGRLARTDQTLDVHGIVDGMASIDFDQDGRADLFLGLSIGNDPFPGHNHLFLNRAGALVEIVSPVDKDERLSYLRAARIASGDLNGDGLDDLLLSGIGDPDAGLRACRTVGYEKIRGPGNTFSLRQREDWTERLPRVLGTFVLADLDADGDLDVLCAGVGDDADATIMCLENKAGVLETVVGDIWMKDSRNPLGPAYGADVIPIDVNGDGKLDLICLARVPGRSAVLLLNVSAK